MGSSPARARLGVRCSSAGPVRHGRRLARSSRPGRTGYGLARHHRWPAWAASALVHAGCPRCRSGPGASPRALRVLTGHGRGRHPGQPERHHVRARLSGAGAARPSGCRRSPATRSGRPSAGRSRRSRSPRATAGARRSGSGRLPRRSPIPLVDPQHAVEPLDYLLARRSARLRAASPAARPPAPPGARPARRSAELPRGAGGGAPEALPRWAGCPRARALRVHARHLGAFLPADVRPPATRRRAGRPSCWWRPASSTRQGITGGVLLNLRAEIVGGAAVRHAWPRACLPKVAGPASALAPPRAAWRCSAPWRTDLASGLSRSRACARSARSRSAPMVGLARRDAAASPSRGHPHRGHGLGDRHRRHRRLAPSHPPVAGSLSGPRAGGRRAALLRVRGAARRRAVVGVARARPATLTGREARAWSRPLGPSHGTKAQGRPARTRARICTHPARLRRCCARRRGCSSASPRRRCRR